MEKKPLSEMGPDEIKKAVSERYGQVATDPCSKFNFPVGRKFAESVGYRPGAARQPAAGFLGVVHRRGQPA